MKIVITGSLGHISRPLTEILLHKGHDITVVSSKEARRAEIEALGAHAAIGTMRDAAFLTETFRGADIVYAMETLGEGAFMDHNLDIVTEITQIGRNYRQAIADAGVKKVIHLSSIGGHTDQGNGMLNFHYNVEQILASLPASVSIKTMRPVGFYYNLLQFIPTIRAQGAIYQNYGGDKKEPWVAPEDIAVVIAEEMEAPFEGRSVRYIASDEVSPNELAQILGSAIGREVRWIEISDAQMEQALIGAGMNPTTAHGYTEMNAGRKTGLYEDYDKHRPVLSPTKLADYAKNVFAAAYSKS
ncbi:MAG: NmrA family NAD(P)-binding protein [Bacteroidetes bacterium]|nr:NmrA family NAD(P)-binding protein [Bacteroidota bacterium]